jgi:hypothetical protein
MNCPNCGQETEAGAAFCGNCGEPLSNTPSPIERVFENQVPATAAKLPTASLAAVGAAAVGGMPTYAVARPHEHATEIKALLAIVCGVLGLASVLLIPLLALGFGLAAIVLGTMAGPHSRLWLSRGGLVLGGVAIAAGLEVWANAVSHNANLKRTLATRNNPPTSTTQAVSASMVDTPCYQTGFIDSLNVNQSASDSCDMNAFNGSNLSESTDIYKVYSNQVEAVTDVNFEAIAKQALEKDVNTTLPGFTVDAERAGLFAGSPSYSINVSDSQHNVAVVEEAVLHKVGAGYNFFVLVHATNGTTTDLRTLESQWQWK